MINERKSGVLVSVAGQRLGAGKYQKNLMEEQVAGTQMPVMNTNGGPANRLEDNDFAHPYKAVQIDSTYCRPCVEDHTTTDQLQLETAM